jgi:hypothetical protein
MRYSHGHVRYHITCAYTCIPTVLILLLFRDLRLAYAHVTHWSKAYLTNRLGSCQASGRFTRIDTHYWHLCQLPQSQQSQWQSLVAAQVVVVALVMIIADRPLSSMSVSHAMRRATAPRSR